MKLRILVQQNNPTPAEIRALQTSTGQGLQACKKELQARTEKLQFEGINGDWEAVPVVYEL
tara:strand:- start:11388 stop:11570 length:183 start_codon:yes stop_codon:yes gene_type:complete